MKGVRSCLAEAVHYLQEVHLQAVKHLVRATSVDEDSRQPGLEHTPEGAELLAGQGDGYGENSDVVSAPCGHFTGTANTG